MSTDMAKKNREQTLGEEIANAITHGLGLVLAIIGMVVLVYKATTQGDMLHIVSGSIFGATLVILYAASTLYHSVQTPRVKRWLRVFDHTAIYLLIAGTYTPFTLVSLQSSNWGWSLFAVVWGLALVGILYKLLAFGRFKKLSLGLYLGMGWLAVVAVKPLWDTLPPAALALMAAGGLAYTFGVIFYVLQKRYFHSVWHVFVMGGSTCHYLAVLLFVVPSAPMT